MDRGLGNDQSMSRDLRHPGDVTGSCASEDHGGHVADGACRRGIGSMANGMFGRNGSSEPVGRHNAQLEVNNGSQWIQATKHINAGGGIFVYYGPT